MGQQCDGIVFTPFIAAYYAWVQCNFDTIISQRKQRGSNKFYTTKKKCVQSPVLVVALLSFDATKQPAAICRKQIFTSNSCCQHRVKWTTAQNRNKGRKTFRAWLLLLQIIRVAILWSFLNFVKFLKLFLSLALSSSYIYYVF